MSGRGAYASPPCMAAEDESVLGIARAETAAPPPDDVAGWRRAERARLRQLRDDLGQAGRVAASRAVCAHLADVLAARGVVRGAVLSGYWPIGGEPDLRPLLSDLHAAGVTIALPVVERRAAPLVFRRWTPTTRMTRGVWNIPVPPADADVLQPQVVLAPCLGWDAGCYRLGWGGGYFDRTLAVLAPRPVAVAIALSAARLPSIHPQPHDIPLDLVVTETGIAAERAGPA